jgi:putative oxidoreductase
MLLKFLGKYRDTGLLIMRFGLGVAFLLHGLPKLVGGPGAWAKLGNNMGHMGIHVFPVFWGFMAAVVLGIGGLLLILGLFYRPICLLLAFTMFVATLDQAAPNERKFEVYSHPLELTFVFVGMACVGPGRFSIDKD